MYPLSTDCKLQDKEDKKGFQFSVFIVVFVFIIAKVPAWSMVWDADGYLRSSLEIVNGSIIDPEQLQFRGVLSSYVYLIPSYIGVHFLEPSVFGTYIYVLVMIQNAILLSWLSAYLIPRIIEVFYPKTKATIISVGVLCVYALQGFTPYSLVDLWAAAFLLPAVYLIHSKSTFHKLILGVMLGICLNLRPSYMVTLIALVVVALFIHRWKTIQLLIGVALAQIPQMAYNWAHYKKLNLFPIGLSELTSASLFLDASSIRVDTLAYSEVAEQQPLLFCDSRMFEIVKRSKPESIQDLFDIFLQHPFAFAIFEARKFLSAFWWPVTSPYSDHNPIVNSVFGAVISLLVVFGSSMLFLIIIKSKKFKFYGGIISIYLGYFVVTVRYHNEPRYGIVIVMLSVCGSILFWQANYLRSNDQSLPVMTTRWLFFTSVVYVVVVLHAYLTLVGANGFANLAACQS